jgi:hypothetical protein
MALDPRIPMSGGLVPDLLQAASGGLRLGQEIRNQPLRRQLMQAQIDRQNQAGQSSGNPAELQVFNRLVELAKSPDPLISQAAKIKLRTAAPAMGATQKIFDIGGVPHQFDPVSGAVIPVRVGGEAVGVEDVGKSKRRITELTERGRGTGKSATNLIDKGFQSIGNIQGNIRNINRAIGALDRGAKTGAVQKFLPSITAASKELDQIKNELGLDVVGAVTFGALSKGELDLALDTALPTGLDEPALRDFLERKRSSQEKLLNYYEEQVLFLDQGGTPAQFIERNRQSRLSTEQQPATPSSAESAADTTGLGGLSNDELLNRLSF